MKLTKEERNAVFQKSGGRCWYCGADLEGTRWQADHFHPIVRFGKQCMYPQLDTIKNLVPACGPCNLYKSDMSIETLRSNIVRQREATLKASMGLRQLHRLGLVSFSNEPVVFWFESEELPHPDLMELLEVGEEAKSVEWREEQTERGCYWAEISGVVVSIRYVSSSHTYLAIMTGDDWRQARYEFQGGGKYSRMIAAQWAIDAVKSEWWRDAA